MGLHYLSDAMMFLFFHHLSVTKMVHETRQSKQCGFSIYIFDNSKSIMKKVKINGQVGQGEEDGLVWSGLC